MKVSLPWLQTYFAEPLPSAEAVAEALTFHSCEIEEIEGDVLDVNVLPDRAAYALSHRGIAYEISASLGVPMKRDPLREPIPTWPFTDALTIEIDTDKSARQMGALIRGVKVGPSPDWLREALESLGQRSINNIVDATNFVTFDIGQPLHAFDAKKIQGGNDALAIRIRETIKGENITTLSGDEFALPEGTVVIADAISGTPLDIAGVKGGAASAITEDTTDLYVSVANFDGTSIRKTAQKLKLWTDASLRFQNRPSPELVAYGMRDIIKLIQGVAGGELVGVVDEYPGQAKAKPLPVTLTLSQINAVLGTDYTLAHIGNAFQTLDFSYLNENDSFTVTPPFERRDIVIPRDLIEEAGRIIGYDSVPVTPLLDFEGANQDKYRGIERIKDILAAHGFTELSTQTFSVTGDIYLANPLDQTRPALRASLEDNMRDALARAAYVAPRVLGPVHEIKLFEIGTVYEKDSEHLSLCLGYKQLEGKHSDTVLGEAAEALSEQLGISMIPVTGLDMVETSLVYVDLEKLGQEDDKAYETKKIQLGPYHPYSIYPFALRDVAVWTPAGTEEDEVENVILKESGELLARIDLFDRFEKKDSSGEAARTSYAFRLVFESSERTLSDEDLNPIMENITNALNAKEGWEVR